MVELKTAVCKDLKKRELKGHAAFSLKYKENFTIKISWQMMIRHSWLDFDVDFRQISRTWVRIYGVWAEMQRRLLQSGGKITSSDMFEVGCSAINAIFARGNWRLNEGKIDPAQMMRIYLSFQSDQRYYGINVPVRVCNWRYLYNDAITKWLHYCNIAKNRY